jgi:glycosyltransferase involved in cell wall biosynthesis
VNVLHLTPSFYPALYWGGPTESGYALCRHLSRLGCSVRVLTSNDNGPTVVDQPTCTDVVLDDGVTVRYCRRAIGDFAPRWLAELPRWMRWADMVHLTAVFSASTPPALAAAALYRKPMVWTPRGSLQPYGLHRRQAFKRAWLRVCRLVRPSQLVLHTTSEQEQADTAQAWPYSPSLLIGNGVDIPQRRPRPDRSGDAGNLRLLFLGRLHPVKALENLISACLLVPAVTLTIAGGGDPTYTRKLQTLVDGLDLAARVRFTGAVTGAAKEAAFAAADVFVMPSQSENFGMAIAEALARELPVIASTGTPWRQLEERGCGLWVDNTPASLADAIRRIAGMPLRQMGSRGRQLVESQYSWHSRAVEMTCLYQRLLRDSAGVPNTVEVSL